MNFDRGNENSDENDEVHFLMTKITAQIKIRKTETDFITIKIRNPTNAYSLNLTVSQRLIS